MKYNGAQTSLMMMTQTQDGLLLYASFEALSSSLCTKENTCIRWAIDLASYYGLYMIFFWVHAHIWCLNYHV